MMFWYEFLKLCEYNKINYKVVLMIVYGQWGLSYYTHYTYSYNISAVNATLKIIFIFLIICMYTKL